jgi:hypothetical protein
MRGGRVKAWVVVDRRSPGEEKTQERIGSQTTFTGSLVNTDFLVAQTPEGRSISSKDKRGMTSRKVFGDQRGKTFEEKTP